MSQSSRVSAVEWVRPGRFDALGSQLPYWRSVEGQTFSRGILIPATSVQNPLFLKTDGHHIVDEADEHGVVKKS